VSVPLLLGIDCGSTVIKATVYDVTGGRVAAASTRLDPSLPHPRWVQRDTEVLWQQTAGAVADVVARAGGADAIAAVGVTGHGDGLYLVDEEGCATRPGILSLDSRAHRVVERWAAEGLLESARDLTGQAPFEAAPAALLRWMVEEEPEVLARSRWVLACKDVLKLKLTGRVAADPTEASTSFCDVRTQLYSQAALELYGLADQWDRLPPIVGSFEVMGEVTAVAARATGLRIGTPVVSGLHDVDACAIGTGAFGPGQASVIAGTYSINQTVAPAAEIDERWFTRSFVRPGEWMHMAVSPASATNLEWFARELGSERSSGDGALRETAFESLIAEAASLADPRGPMFLPFLYGSPLGAAPSGGFLGLRGWHRRGHLVAAVMEGVVLNHRWHLADLRSRFELHEVRLTGGGARSDVWSQLFADGLGLPVMRTRESESGTLGAAICAGLGAGLFSSLENAVAATVTVVDVRRPMEVRAAELSERYEVFRAVTEALGRVWPRLE
jgi:L-xylulokinase